MSQSKKWPPSNRGIMTPKYFSYATSSKQRPSGLYVWLRWHNNLVAPHPPQCFHWLIKAPRTVSHIHLVGSSWMLGTSPAKRIAEKSWPSSQSPNCSMYSTTKKGGGSWPSPDQSPPCALWPSAPSSSNWNDNMQKRKRKRHWEKKMNRIEDEDSTRRVVKEIENMCGHLKF